MRESVSLTSIVILTKRELSFCEVFNKKTDLYFRFSEYRIIKQEISTAISSSSNNLSYNNLVEALPNIDLDKDNWTYIVWSKSLVIYKVSLSDTLEITHCVQVTDTLHVTIFIKNIPHQAEWFHEQMRKHGLTLNLFEHLLRKLSSFNASYINCGSNMLPDHEKIYNVEEYLINKIKVCRVCLVSESQIDKNMFHQITQDVQNWVYGNVKKNFGMPELVCSACILKVQDFVSLRQQAMESMKFFTKQIPININDNTVHEDLVVKGNENNVIMKEEEDDDIYDETYGEADNIEYDIRSYEEAEELTEVKVEINVKQEKTRPKSTSEKSKVKRINKTKPLSAPKKYNKKGQKGVRMCDFCGAVYEYRELLVTHMKRKHMFEDVECQICNKKFNNKVKLQSHMAHHAKKHVCEICMKAYVSPNQLKRHMQVHKIKSNDFICSKCGEGFATRNLLADHVRKVHDGDDDGQLFTCMCDICGKKFLEESSMSVHKRTHNPNIIKALYCPVSTCGERMRDQAHLAEHIVIHKIVYNCNICARKFTNAGDLADHQKTHENENRPFICTECSRCYANKNQLNVHIMRVHRKDEASMHECELCSKTFMAAWELRVHERSHSDEKIASCPLCERSYKSTNDIKKHMAVSKLNWQQNWV